MSIPSQVYVLGALPGSINVILWTLLNMYLGIVQGNFRNRHPKCRRCLCLPFAHSYKYLTDKGD